MRNLRLTFIMPGKADPQVTEISRQMARQADVPYMVRSDVGGRRLL